MPAEQTILPIFRHPQHPATAGRLWDQARAAARAPDTFELLLALAHLECALEDAGWTQARPALQPLVQAAAAAYLGLAPRPALEPLGDALPPPETPLSLGAWEGIEHYALWPAGYADAARQWRAAHPGEHAWVIGLRSAGSLLAPIVAAAIGAERWTTVRPEGHPYDRQVALDISQPMAATGRRPERQGRPRRHSGGPAERASLPGERSTPTQRPAGATRAKRGEPLALWPGAVLLVDEGPGRSGSSFGGAVRHLVALGIPLHRIALLPAYAPAADQVARLENRYAAGHWNDWQVYAAAPLPPPDGAGQDVSGGRWRGVLHPDPSAPAWPAHERLKFLADRGFTLIKFAGWGPHGRAVRERAQRLAAAGWGPAVRSREDGPWLRYERLQFAPLRHPTTAWCEHAGRYLAWVEQEFGLSLDGRMWPCEWGETDRGWVKFDATDHHDDPFLPGPRDIAWDLATVGEEMGAPAGEAVLAAYCRARGTPPARMMPRLQREGAVYRQFRQAWRALAAA